MPGWMGGAPVPGGIWQAPTPTLQDYLPPPYQARNPSPGGAILSFADTLLRGYMGQRQAQAEQQARQQRMDSLFQACGGDLGCVSVAALRSGDQKLAAAVNDLSKEQRLQDRLAFDLGAPAREQERQEREARQTPQGLRRDALADAFYQECINSPLADPTRCVQVAMRDAKAASEMMNLEEDDALPKNMKQAFQQSFLIDRRNENGGELRLSDYTDAERAWKEGTRLESEQQGGDTETGEIAATLKSNAPYWSMMSAGQKRKAYQAARTDRELRDVLGPMPDDEKRLERLLDDFESPRKPNERAADYAARTADALAAYVRLRDKKMPNGWPVLSPAARDQWDALFEYEPPAPAPPDMRGHPAASLEAERAPQDVHRLPGPGAIADARARLAGSTAGALAARPLGGMAGLMPAVQGNTPVAPFVQQQPPTIAAFAGQQPAPMQWGRGYTTGDARRFLRESPPRR